MESRTAKLQISKAGGTAGKNSKTYKVTIPSQWVNELALADDTRELEILYDGEQITLRKKSAPDDFLHLAAKSGHDVKTYKYWDNDTLCSTIHVDFTDRLVKVINHVDAYVKTAFGNNSTPSWNDLMEFFEERCISKNNAVITDYLSSIGLIEYNPISIINITEGRMAEDDQWISVETYEA